jgi:hypothetical protein
METKKIVNKFWCFISKFGECSRFFVGNTSNNSAVIPPPIVVVVVVVGVEITSSNVF